MDNLRKANVFLGKAISDVNTESDQVVDSIMATTLGEWIDELQTVPDFLRKLTFGDFMDIILDIDEDHFEETVKEKIFEGREPSEEEAHEFFNGLMTFATAIGLSDD